MSNTMRFATSLFCVLAACKPAATPDSSIKTLDALAGTETAPNDCRGSYPSLTAWQNDADQSLASKARDQIKYPASAAQAVDQVFTAVPAGLVRTVLLLGYELHFVDDPASACAGIDAGALTSAHGCAKSESVMVDGQEGEKVVLILSADAEDVAHSTLTGVMTLVSQKLGRLAAEDGSLVVKEEDDQAMVDFRKELSIAVLHDAALRGLTLEPLKGLLPQASALTSARSTLAERRTLWSEFAEASPAKAAAVESMIFANTGDSYYCSADTRQRFSAWETASRLWIEAMVPDISALESLGKAEGADGLETASDGFGLWGRWGAGNGPMRQMFSNRVQDTGYAFPRANGLRRGWDGSGNWYSPPAWGQGRLGWRLRG